ncbi:histidine kinase [Duganella sp. LX20W]|uniref:Histidine kinase n=1 Tax=Rugamonas brunnea TaxID=2758569 RepID=A0A7W2EN35_9BURK|nr:ATP-binding protein [Rugamonas brunnea]MBA5635522.1 histidine kinase [Rugamonas brunnea]
MPVPASPPTDPTTPEAQRSAELSELLGHVHTCWDDERRSLSRQLHDSLGSSLTALTMHLGLLMQKMPPEPALQERAAHMKQLLHQIVETNRDMQHRLWNDKLEFLGVRVALAEQVAQFEASHGLAVHCSLPEEELDCPRSHSVVLLRALEEALANVATHAQATAVDVIVDDNEEQLMLTVRDDGVGLPDGGDLPTQGKYGLRMARERAAHLGGQLSVTANGQRGVQVTVVLPKPFSAA